MNDKPAVFSPRGRIDGTNSSAIEAELRPLLDGKGVRLVFDLSSIDYLSSAGLRVVLLAAKTTRAGGGKTVLSGAKPAVLEVLRMSGFDRILEIEPDLDAALARLT